MLKGKGGERDFTFALFSLLCLHVCVCVCHHQFDPSERQRYVDYLIEIGEHDRAALDLYETINFNALEHEESGTTRNAKLWSKLSQLIHDYPTEITLINVGRVLRSGLKMKESVQQHGVLWCALATYHIQMGHFEKARDVYEEALEKVNTVADFSQVFDAYSQFEEQLISIKMANMEEEEEEEEENNHAVENGPLFTSSDDLDMRFARLEHLMTRRPFLLSSVKLRQNPHNVHEWHKRVKLFLAENDYEQVVKTYLQAVEKIDPQQAVGKPHTIWCAFAKYYEFKLKDIESARMIFERAATSDFKTVDELANVWCEYAEMELRNKNYREARSLLQRATARPSMHSSRVKSSAVYTYDTEPASSRLYKSVKLWSLYLDVEESMGTVESTIALYDRCMALKIATVPLVINYANFLEENRYYEHAFKTMERAVNVFPYPQVYHVWINYLTKFMDRYKSDRIERARDLFEEALKKVPQEFSKGMYLLYAKLEEEYGLAKHAMSIYDRAIRAVKPEERYEMYLIYIARASEYYGVTRTREIYEKAIQQLPDRDVSRICLLYARLERQLGEIDRARAIYAHGCRMVNPNPKDDEFGFWKAFETFEEQHGNMETYKDFLRLRRAVQSNLSMANLSSVAMERAQKEFEERRQKLQEERRNKQRQEALQRKMEIEAATGDEEQEAYENEEEISIELAPVPESLFEKNVRK